MAHSSPSESTSAISRCFSVSVSEWRSACFSSCSSRSASARVSCASSELWLDVAFEFGGICSCSSNYGARFLTRLPRTRPNATPSRTRTCSSACTPSSTQSCSRSCRCSSCVSVANCASFSVKRFATTTTAGTTETRFSQPRVPGCFHLCASSKSTQNQTAACTDAFRNALCAQSDPLKRPLFLARACTSSMMRSVLSAAVLSEHSAPTDSLCSSRSPR